MREVSSANFGLLIAYLLPGFIALWGISYFSVTVQAWLSAASSQLPTVGGFLYVTVASVGVGMIVKLLRWLTLEACGSKNAAVWPQEVRSNRRFVAAGSAQ